MQEYSASIRLAENNSFSPGSNGEIQQFKKLQQKLPKQFKEIFPDPLAPKTVVIVPSLTLDQQILAKVKGHVYYEERMLCLLMLLRMPNTFVVYVTSIAVDPVIVDYYLHLLPGITGYHARQRLTLLSCYDASHQSLTEKILARPRLLERIRKAIPENHHAHMACFNVTTKERTLAVQLGIPIFGCDPDLYHLGSKSECRQMFRKCGIAMPAGYEDLRDEKEIIDSLRDLKLANPSLRKAVIKMNDGFSGEGNAVFSFNSAPANQKLEDWLRKELPARLKIVADGLNYEQFISKFSVMQGVVEEFIEGKHKTSPSVQCRINPLGETEIMSTHDQLLGGESGQVFLGAIFPARKAYSVELGQMGKTIAEELKKFGVLGRFSVDFLSVREKNQWKHYAIETNLRKGGTTHPFLMLQFLTDGVYDENAGIYRMPNGQTRCYYATDNLKSDKYKGLTPHDLIEIAIANNLHYDATHQEGVMFHLVGALSEHGKLGLVCIGSNSKKVNQYYNRTVEILEKEGDYHYP